jgi:hypothetical protein
LQKTLKGNHYSPDFLEHQEAANASPSNKDPYVSPCKDFKLISWPVQELWWSKVELTNPDVRSSRTTQQE